MALVTVTPNYKPHAKQMLLHNAPVSFEDIWIILFGGSRGSGKSAAVLADAVMFASTYPGAKCCILRENLDAVKQSFLDKLPSLFPQEVNGIKLYEYREKSTSWYPSRSIVFPNGSYITLQRVADYREAMSKQGWEFQYLAIDEVTKQEERSVDYLLTTVRSVATTNKYTGKPLRIPTKVVFSCNPGGIGHKWVKHRFIDHCVVEKNEHGTPTRTVDHVEMVQHPQKPDVKIKRTIRFIPATFGDNPYLNDAYIANLMAQPQHMIEKDVYGNWDIVAGKMFEFDQAQQFLEWYEIRKIMEQDYDPFEVYISIDWGFRPSYHCALWHAVFSTGRVVTFKEMYGQDLVFEDFVKAIAEKSKDMHISATLLPHDMFRHGDRYRDDNGRIIGETKADVFESAGLCPLGVESGKGKVQMRYDKIHSATRIQMSDGVYKFRIASKCDNLVEEFDGAVYDEVDPSKIAKGCREHAIDAYGHFLVFYSSEISPLGMETFFEDKRSRLQKMLDAEEEALDLQDEDAFVAIDDYWDL